MAKTEGTFDKEALRVGPAVREQIGHAGERRAVNGLTVPVEDSCNPAHVCDLEGVRDKGASIREPSDRG